MKLDLPGFALGLLAGCAVATSAVAGASTRTQPVAPASMPGDPAQTAEPRRGEEAVRWDRLEPGTLERSARDRSKPKAPTFPAERR